MAEIREQSDESAGSVGPIFLEVKCAIGARADLGRPTTSAKENKEAFMRGLSFRAK